MPRWRKEYDGGLSFRKMFPPAFHDASSASRNQEVTPQELARIQFISLASSCVLHWHLVCSVTLRVMVCSIEAATGISPWRGWASGPWASGPWALGLLGMTNAVSLDSQAFVVSPTLNRPWHAWICIAKSGMRRGGRHRCLITTNPRYWYPGIMVNQDRYLGRYICKHKVRYVPS